MVSKEKKSKIDCLLLHVPCIDSISLVECVYFVNFIAMGVFSISNELYKNNLQPQIIHMGVEKALDSAFDIGQYVKEHNIKVVGLSLHWHQQTYDTLTVAKYIKTLNPKVHIFLGGITSSAFAEDILKTYPQIDSVIKGEGEKPAVEFLKLLKQRKTDFSDVPNLYWRDKNGEIHKNETIWFANEDELNSYNFDGLEFLRNSKTYLNMPFFYHKYINNPKRVELAQPKQFICCLGRGCPGNCTWCGGGYNATKIITGRDRVTLRSPEVVAKEFISFKKKYDLDIFYICHDPYPQKQEHLIKLFNILGKEMPKKINIFFESFGLPTKEFIDALKKNMGERSAIILSPDFGDEQMRNKHKAFSYTTEEFLSCVEYLSQLNIYTPIYFVNLPKEPSQSMIGTHSLITELKNRKYKNIEIIRQNIEEVEPYSPWYLEPEKYCGNLNLSKIEDYYNNSKHCRDFI